MKKIILYFITALCINISSVYAGDAGNVEIDIPTAVDMAFGNSEDIKINRESLKKLDNIYREVRASVFPQVTGALGVNRFIESPVMKVDLGEGEVSIPMASDWESSIDLKVSQVLWAFGKVMNVIRLAENYINLEKHSADITRNELTYAVKQVYYSMLLADDIAKIATESHKNALKNKDALKGRYSGGRISNINNIKMEADISGRVPSMLQAEQSYELVEVTMRDILGVPEENDIVLTEKFITVFSEFDYDNLRSSMLSREPVLMVYREKLNLADTKIRLKKSSFYPTLSGFMSYSYGGGDDKIIPDDMNSELVAGVMLNYDIWDSGKRKNSYRQAENDRNIAEFDYRKMERALDVELKSAITEYRALIKIYDANRRAVKLAGEAYEIALSSFKSGAVSQTMLNDAELQLTGAKMRERTTLYNINIVIAMIEKLTAENRR
ncbi:MAG: TolC family protein [Elusimicrobiota bacterium]